MCTSSQRKRPLGGWIGPLERVQWLLHPCWGTPALERHSGSSRVTTRAHRLTGSPVRPLLERSHRITDMETSASAFVDTLEVERQRLQNAVDHLQQSNRELRQAIEEAGPDRDFKEAIEVWWGTCRCRGATAVLLHPRPCVEKPCSWRLDSHR